MVRLIDKIASLSTASLVAGLFGALVFTDATISFYTVLGGFHAHRDPALATDCVAGLHEAFRTVLQDKGPQQSLLCMAFVTLTLTTLNCYFLLSFLGLYGIFITQLMSLTFFWASLLLNVNTFLIEGGSAHIVFCRWFTLANSLEINLEFYLDVVSFSFALLTTTIAVFVNLYAFSYFRYEPNVDRLLLFINSFVISMVILVFAGNLALLFMGWELIGLTSFLLINFWATRVGTLKAAFKAYTFNKISDFFMLIGLLLCAITFNDLSIPAILTEFDKTNAFYLTNIVHIHNLDFIALVFLGASFIKSAQIGGHLWLPDSMEAPVPASALIHSATLVSAGVFLILRLHPLFEHTFIFYLVTPVVGAFTAMYGGLVAYYQTDLKRILAYSTISHCGFLIFMTTLGAVEFTLAYLYVHGFFKAIAFLCAGNLIRFCKNYQDLRRMGQLWKYLPFECAAMTLALANLSGAPFFFGFCIKHLALASVDKIYFFWLVQPLLLIASSTGVLYSYKIVYYAFFDTKKGRASQYTAANRDPLCSHYYSNSTLASLLSITLLTLAAYVLVSILLYYLISLKNLLVDTNVLFLKNQGVNNLHIDRFSLFNYSFLNWLVIIFSVSLGFVKWGRVYGSAHSPERLLEVASFAFFLYIFCIWIAS